MQKKTADLKTELNSTEPNNLYYLHDSSFSFLPNYKYDSNRMVVYF
jgi:hypothetical protein